MKREIFNLYLESISSRFDVPKDDIFTKTKRREIVDALHVLYYMCSERPMKISYIQMYMKESGYDIAHSSIIHGIRQVKLLVDSDKDYHRMISEIEETIKN